MNFNFKEIVQSKVFGGFIAGLGLCLIIFIAFQIGTFVGYRQANFSAGLGDNYRRVFGGGKESSMFGPEMLPGAHGVAGKVLKIDLPRVFVSGPDNVEKIVVVDDKTEVKKFKEECKISDLKEGDFIAVIGQPNDTGEVRAKFLRIMPEPPMVNSNPK